MKKDGYTFYPKGSIRIFFSLLLLLPLSGASQIPGKLYGFDWGAGFEAGNIITYDPLNNRSAAIFTFNSSNGGHPYGNLIQDTNGMLYGMTSIGGNKNIGVLFQYNVVTGVDSVIHNFTGGNQDGSTPYGSLILANNGLLYGLTFAGGIYGYGTLFSFNTKNYSLQVLVSFDQTSGMSPTGSLMQASDTLLYGTTTSGGIYDSGALFSYNIPKDTEIILINFNKANGWYPRGGVIQDKYNSLLYGLTEYGGSTSAGVLYSYNITSGQETILTTFGEGNGVNPPEVLMQASDSLLYGMTSSGGPLYGYGTLFNFNPSTGILNTLVQFNDTDGQYPIGDVIQASNGLLYGNTAWGGSNDTGVLFRYNIDSNTYKVVLNYHNFLGVYPAQDMLEVMSISDSLVNNHCPNDSIGFISVKVRGDKPPVTYLWSNGATTSSLSGLISGVYTCKITDARGISIHISDTIKPQRIELTFLENNPCYDSTNGLGWVTITGGFTPYTYRWSTGAATDTISNLAPGTYTCNVTDADGCPAQSVMTIASATPIKITGFTSIPASCDTCHNGSIKVFVTGGVPPGDSAIYFYAWTIGGDADSVYGIPPGVDSICVTSYYGCGETCDSAFILTAIPRYMEINDCVKIYPVPSRGQETLLLTGGGFQSLELYNEYGLLLYSSRLDTDEHSISNILDFSRYPDGVYALRLLNLRGAVTKKISIQK